METTDQHPINVRLRAQDWAKVLGAIMGTVALAVSLYLSTISDIRQHSEAIRALQERAAVIEATAGEDRKNVDRIKSKIEDSLNAIARDVGYMRGILEQRNMSKTGGL